MHNEPVNDTKCWLHLSPPLTPVAQQQIRQSTWFSFVAYVLSVFAKWYTDTHTHTFFRWKAFKNTCTRYAYTRTHTHEREGEWNNKTSIKCRQKNINSISLFGACSIVSSRVVCCWQPSRICNIRTRLCHLVRLWKYTHARTNARTPAHWRRGWENERKNAIKRNARYKYLFMLTIRWAAENERMGGSCCWCCCCHCGGDDSGNISVVLSMSYVTML